MGNCECGLKGNPCGTLRPNTINVTMPATVPVTTLMRINNPPWIFAAISLIPSVCWYTHAHFVATAELVMGSGHTHVFGGDGFGIVSVGAYWRILERTLTGGLTPLVAAGMFAGLFLWPSSRFDRTFHWWLFAIVLFVIFVGKENSKHTWYQLPIVPVAAAFSGLAFERLLARISSVKIGFASARTVAIALIAALSYSAYVFVKPLYNLHFQFDSDLSTFRRP